MSFDWQTEDRDWDERERPRRGAPPTDLPALNEALFAGLEGAPPAARPARAGRRRALLFLGAVAILAVALAAVIWWQVTTRTRLAEERVTADVLASQETILEAARDGDGELFVSFLSGRDPEWARAQEMLVRDGGLLDRSPFELTWDPRSSVVTPTVTLAPDLRSAELVTPQTYVLDVGNGVVEAVTLLQTEVFRRGPDRWLLSPPSDEFWGEEAVVGGRYLLVRYPARDAATAERLARELDGVLAQLCRDAGEECLNLGQLDLTLATDPASLAAYAAPQEAWSGGRELTLPTPTLFGAPVDEAGYRAMFRAYAARVVSAAAANLSGWACCDDLLFYGALRDALLHRLGLRAWPVTPADYEQLVQHPENLGDVERLWRARQATAGERRSLYTVIDFLVAREGAPPIIDMQRLLLDSLNRSYGDWLSVATNGAYGTQADFERDLLRYADARRAVAAPPALPDQALLLVCRRAGALRPELVRADPAGGEPVRVSGLATFADPMIAPLPARDGVVIFGRRQGEDALATTIWRDGASVPVTFTEEGPPLVALPGAAHDDALLLVQDSPSSTPLYALLPLDDCNGDGLCRADAILGPPSLSPDGALSILSVGQPSPLVNDRWQSMLYLGDPAGSPDTLIELGVSPFWLDSQTFGYIGLAPDPAEQRVVTRAVLRNDEVSDATLLFTSTRLNRLPLGEEGSSRIIDRVISNPTRPELLVFTASPFRAGQSSLMLAYDLASAEFHPRLRFGDEPADYHRAYRFSPDGRWLAVATLKQAAAGIDRPEWSVYVQSTDGAITRGYALRGGDTWPADWLMDWTADGRWLALAGSGYVRLIAPEEDYTMPLILPDRACSAAVWVN